MPPARIKVLLLQKAFQDVRLFAVGEDYFIIPLEGAAAKMNAVRFANMLFYFRSLCKASFAHFRK